MNSKTTKQWTIWSTICVLPLLFCVWLTYYIVSEPEQPPEPQWPVSASPKKPLPPPHIDAGPTQIRWPNANEPNVLWNAQRQLVLETVEGILVETQNVTGEAAKPHTYVFAASVPEPISEVQETPEVIELGLQVVGEYLTQNKIGRISNLAETVFDENFFDYLGMRDQLDNSFDRTLRVAVHTPSLFTPEFVRTIQQQLLAKWPLWRVLLIASGEPGEDHLVIYPDFIFIGANQCDRAKMDEPILSWQAALERNREPGMGPRRRQIAYLIPQLPKAIRELKTRPMTFVAAFDNIYGQFDQYSIWVLHPRHETIAVSAPANSWIGPRSFAVNSEGAVVPDDDPSGSFKLAELGLRGKNIADVVLTYGDGSKTWTCPATAGPIIKDVELRKQEPKTVKPH